MSNVTVILSKIQSGDPSAAAQLLPLVYDELRKLAASRLANEKVGHSLQATALVHEAYLRLVGNGESDPSWDHRGHFFAAAAEAMRRILVESARRNMRAKRGAGLVRQELCEEEIAVPEPHEDLIALDEALDVAKRERKPKVALPFGEQALTIGLHLSGVDLQSSEVARGRRRVDLPVPTSQELHQVQ